MSPTRLHFLVPTPLLLLLLLALAPEGEVTVVHIVHHGLYVGGVVALGRLRALDLKPQGGAHSVDVLQAHLQAQLVRPEVLVAVRPVPQCRTQIDPNATLPQAAAYHLDVTHEVVGGVHEEASDDRIPLAGLLWTRVNLREVAAADRHLVRLDAARGARGHVRKVHGAALVAVAAVVAAGEAVGKDLELVLARGVVHHEG
mmetsp:Transcript_6638/g.17111  ORF Transcript_6638/g.17111 Transcript_6638/m.17111 type:complete len:200 (-) Transcript_6638:554-1153(-)